MNLTGAVNSAKSAGGTALDALFKTALADDAAFVRKLRPVSNPYAEETRSFAFVDVETGAETTYTGITDAHPLRIGDTVTVSGTGEAALDVPQTVTGVSIDMARVTTALDSTGTSGSGGVIAYGAEQETSIRVILSEFTLDEIRNSDGAILLGDTLAILRPLVGVSRFELTNHTVKTDGREYQIVSVLAADPLALHWRLHLR